jgi:hypothetical protein
MFGSVLGARMRWHLANGWVFDPAAFQSDVNAQFSLVERIILEVGAVYDGSL